MNIVGNFHKVSFDRFLKDSIQCGFVTNDMPIEIIKEIWEKIKFPRRATNGSAGYDFSSPFPFCLQSGQSVNIPTGISATIAPGWFLMMLPRSGLSFHYGTRLANTASVVDSDYFYSENEGHIFAKLTCEKNLSLQNGDRFAQGIFLPFGIIETDDAIAVRNGGIGSTGVSS